MVICNSCGQDREFFKEGVCIICNNADSGAKIVENSKFNPGTTTEVKSRTGRIDDNIHLSRNQL